MERSPHETFTDSDGQLYYRAELTASGVRFIREALVRMAPDDLFTERWEQFERRCRLDYWEQT